MEKVLTTLCDFGRFRELELLLPQKRQQMHEEKYHLREGGTRAAQAKWELDRLEKGGIFRRFLGNQEEKKEKYYREHREARAEEMEAKQRMDVLKKELEEAECEYETLSGSWEKYLAAKAVYLAEGGEVEALVDKLRPILVSLAVREIGECLAKLEEARPWMQADVRTTRISPDNQKLEFLSNARTHAEITLRLLEQLPEGSVEIPTYLRSPDGFIQGVTMKYKQLDRLNLAQEQLRNLRKQLREQ